MRTRPPSAPEISPIMKARIATPTAQNTRITWKVCGAPDLMKPACASVCTSFSPLGVLRSGGGILREAHLKTRVEMVACCASSSSPPCATRILKARSVNRSSITRFLANIARYTPKPAALSKQKNIIDMNRELILVIHSQQAPDGEQRHQVHHARGLQNLLAGRIVEQR